MFKHLKLKTKLILGIGIVAVLTLGGIGVTGSLLTNSIINNLLKSELSGKLTDVYSLIETYIDSSVKNHLSTSAGDAKKIIEYYYNMYKTGKMKEKEALSKVKEFILDAKYGKIGETGYLTIFDSNGRVIIHPKYAEGEDLSKFDFIKKGCEMKSGYLEYPWKNPDEKVERMKAVGLDYFEKWDMVIWATAYKSEFKDLLDIKSLREKILAIKIGETGYPFIIDGKGVLIVHPTSEGQDISNLPHIKKMMETKNGVITYKQETEGKKKGFYKIVYYKYMEAMDWIITAGSYTDEFSSSIQGIGLKLGIILFAALLIIIIFSVFFANYIVKGLYMIQIKLSNIASGSEKADLTKRLEFKINDEIGNIGKVVNELLEKLNVDIMEVEKISNKLKSSSDKSNEIVSKSSHNLTAIKESIGSIDNQIENSTSGIEELTATLEEMSRNIDSIMNNMVRQASAVEEEASSIEEMVRNIDNTASMSKKTQGSLK